MEELQSLATRINCLIFRSLMISSSVEEIVNGFETEDDYIDFVNMISDILSENSRFLLLKNFIDKTQMIISLGSEKFADAREIRLYRNRHIFELNRLNSRKDKDIIIRECLNLETIMRCYLPYTDKLLFNSMSNDYYVFTKLLEAVDGNNSLNQIDNHQFLESSSFFMCILPEIYQFSSKITELTGDEITRISSEDPAIKKYIKPIKKNLSKFK